MAYAARGYPDKENLFGPRGARSSKGLLQAAPAQRLGPQLLVEDETRQLC